jgi:hypothetical protein
MKRERRLSTVQLLRQKEVLRRRIEKKLEDVLGEDQFGFRKGKGTRDAIGMLTISE